MEHEDCGSSDALQVYQDEDGSYNGFCFSCNTYVADPLGDKSEGEVKELAKSSPTKSKEQIKEEMDFIDSLGCVDLPNRKLRVKSLSHFGIKIGLSESDGKTPTFAYFPYTKRGKIVKYKVKHLPTGRVWSVGLDNDVDLFGWEQAKASGVRRLIIVEGEFDCPALFKILATHTSEQYKESIPAIVSIPNGAGSAVKSITKALPEIRKYFQDVSLAFDMDEKGEKAVREVCKIASDFKVINLPAKDANECIHKGVMKAAHKACIFNVGKAKNTRLIWGRDIHDDAKKKAEYGLSYPWDGMTELTRGIRFGETIYLGAGEKMGKSEVVNALAAHLIKVHKLKVMLAKPEESNNKTYKLLNSKVVGKIFHDPKVDFDEDAYDKGGEVIKDSVCMLNLYQNIDWEVLKGDIYAAAGEGVKAVFIDPITNLTNGMSSTQINEALQGIAQELAMIAKDLDIVIFIFCHLNKPPKGATPWDRGGVITTDYFAGSSAMARSCNYAMGIQGNKDPELSKEERNFRSLVVLADREFGESGEVKLYWDYKTGFFNEVRDN